MDVCLPESRRPQARGVGLESDSTHTLGHKGSIRKTSLSHTPVCRCNVNDVQHKGSEGSAPHLDQVESGQLSRWCNGGNKRCFKGVCRQTFKCFIRPLKVQFVSPPVHLESSQSTNLPGVTRLAADR